MVESLGNFSLSLVVAFIAALVVVFLLGYGLGIRRGQKKRRWYS